MPLPTPAEFRDRTKKHSQVRELLAQLAENVLGLDIANDNPLFKPVRLEETSVVSEITTAGIYHVPTDALAASLGLPSNKAGQLYVSGNTRPPNSGYVFQTYINTNGEVFQTIRTTAWSAWNGQSRRVLSGSDNLNELIASGIYHASSGSIATSQNNYPFTGTGGIILVENSGTTVRQQMLSSGGGHKELGY